MTRRWSDAAAGFGCVGGDHLGGRWCDGPVLLHPAHLCMCVCVLMCVYAYVRTYVHTCNVCMNLCTHCMPGRMYAFVCVQMCRCLHACMHTHARTHIRLSGLTTVAHLFSRTRAQRALYALARRVLTYPIGKFEESFTGDAANTLFVGTALRLRAYVCVRARAPSRSLRVCVCVCVCVSVLKKDACW